jgi:8-oxo-dGTP diphosphatase
MKPNVEATLCQIINDGHLLLQMKSIGRFGEGKWNGPGGKLLEGETPSEGVVREVFEETGLKVSSLTYHGGLYHYFGQEEKPDWLVHIFSTKTFKGDIKESEEGELKWFSFKEIPYKKMWQDDEYWLPMALEEKRFTGSFYFNKDGSELIHHELIPQP